MGDLGPDVRPWTILDTNIFHPATRTLFYGPTGAGALVLFAPVFLVTGNPIFALNATFLGGAILTTVALHLVVPIAVLSTVRIVRDATRAAGWRLAGALVVALLLRC